MPTELSDLERKLADLEKRTAKVEGYFKIALAAALVLGIGGGFIYGQLRSVSSQVAEEQTRAERWTKDAQSKISDAGTQELDRIRGFSKSPAFRFELQRGLVKEDTPYQIESICTFKRLCPTAQSVFKGYLDNKDYRGVVMTSLSGVQVWKFVPSHPAP